MSYNEEQARKGISRTRPVYIFTEKIKNHLMSPTRSRLCDARWVESLFSFGLWSRPVPLVTQGACELSRVYSCTCRVYSCTCSHIQHSYQPEVSKCITRAEKASKTRRPRPCLTRARETLSNIFAKPLCVESRPTSERQNPLSKLWPDVRECASISRQN